MSFSCNIFVQTIPIFSLLINKIQRISYGLMALSVMSYFLLCSHTFIYYHTISKKSYNLVSSMQREVEVNDTQWYSNFCDRFLYSLYFNNCYATLNILKRKKIEHISFSHFNSIIIVNEGQAKEKWILG